VAGHVAYSALVAKHEERGNLDDLRVDANILKLILKNRTGC
jgi:hypothetical protein